MILPPLDNSFARDIAAISRIDAVERVLDVICETTGMGFAAVARVTDSRWVACAVRDRISFGLHPGNELEIDTTLCRVVRDADVSVAIDHVAIDEVYHDHRTPLLYGFQSYVSVPVRLPDGEFFGTLCAVDPNPAEVNSEKVLGMFRLFADLIAMRLDAERRREAGAAAVLDEHDVAQLREQLVAVLDHDLRDPVDVIRTGTQLLGDQPHSDLGQRVLAIMRNSVWRMAGLVDDVVDFTRSRLGADLTARIAPTTTLARSLRHVVAERQSASPDRAICAEFALDRPIECDAARLAQLLSNLLANAVAYGDPAGEIDVRASSDLEGFQLSVTNLGPTIPSSVMAKLFRPFVRGDASPGRQGLGLGLYLASEIARAHGGALSATSQDNVTCFTFAMPLAQSVA